MTHTPGPWRVGRPGAVVTPNIIENGPQGSDDVDYYGGNLICESVTSANARLIAQAPNLLWLVESFVALSSNDKCTAINEMLIKEAKDTIDKIRGEQ
jgi:hypothetical protein